MLVEEDNYAVLWSAFLASWEVAAWIHISSDVNLLSFWVRHMVNCISCRELLGHFLFL
jgi:hypothetical protein